MLLHSRSPVDDAKKGNLMKKDVELFRLKQADVSRC